MEILTSSAEDSAEGAQLRLYRTPLHEITLSAASSKLEEHELSAADVEIRVNTIAGDIHLKQVRIDLGRVDEVLSVYGNKRMDVLSGGHEYSIEILNDMVDGIIRDGGRLAIDITLSSNWNFFGEYRLKLRISRRA
jgi:hypothetical protein